MAPSVRLGDKVSLHYRLSCAGQVIVDTFRGHPDTFVLGQGDIDPRLEALILSMDRGQHRIFDLEPWQAFGERDETLIHTLPRSDFPADSPLATGHTAEFPLPNGQVLTGTILDLDSEVVRIDFNHPLAGLPVQFEVEVLTVNQASSS